MKLKRKLLSITAMITLLSIFCVGCGNVNKSEQKSKKV